MDSTRTDTTGIDSLGTIDEDTAETAEDSVSISEITEEQVPIKPAFLIRLEDCFSFTRRIYPDSLIVPPREFSNILVGSSFLPVIVGPPGQARSVYLYGNPSSNPYLNFNGGITPETYWGLPHFRGPDLNSFPTEGIDQVAILDGAPVIASGFNGGMETIDIRLTEIDTEPDTTYPAESNVTVLRAAAGHHRTGMELKRRGPFKSNFKAFFGLSTSNGYLPRSEYHAIYYGLKVGVRFMNLPIILSGYRYRARGEYTVFDYFYSQNAHFSRDLISLAAKTYFSVTDSSRITLKTFINRRPHTAVDPTLDLYYRTINTIAGFSSDYELHKNDNIFFASLKSWYEKMRAPYIGNPETSRGSVALGDIYNMSDGLSIMGLVRFDAADDYEGKVSGSVGINLKLYKELRWYIVGARQTVYPDLHTLYWQPSSYPSNFDIAGYDYIETGNPNLTIGYRDRMEAGFVASSNLFAIKSGISFASCEDMIRYGYSQSEFDIVLSPKSTDYDMLSIYSNLKINSFLDLFHGDIGFRYSDIAYDDGTENFFIPKLRLYAGGYLRREILIENFIIKAGMEAEFTSDRYIPGLTTTYEDYYWVVNTSIAVSYKDLTFYYNGDNIFDQIYYSMGLNPVLGGYNWWGISWDFYN
ncbi:MAG: hypothetical protein GF315_12810 [candidate division Zixibacteria bacterium]|nr:hypothetical protein [candidate division Zixibacteria bacterium]